MEHKHTELVEGCYRCDLNLDEMPEEVKKSKSQLNREARHMRGPVYKTNASDEPIIFPPGYANRAARRKTK